LNAIHKKRYAEGVYCPVVIQTSSKKD